VKLAALMSRPIVSGVESMPQTGDLLIGDLFKDNVDEVIEPMNQIRAEAAQHAAVQ
jgi:hypothetical protein